MKLLTTPDIGRPGKPGTFEIQLDAVDANTASVATGITVPANSLVKFRTSRLTAFDSAASDVLNVGKTGTLNAYISALDLQATGLTAEAAYHVTDETDLLIGITTVGLAATHGMAKVFVEITRLS